MHTMQSTQPLKPRETADTLLNEPVLVKKYALEIIGKYVSNPESKLDGSLHPGLDVSGSLVRLDPGSHKWVANV